MELPRGIETKWGTCKTHVLKLLKNLYGCHNAGRDWNINLVEGLIAIGFQQSSVDKCIFYQKEVIFAMYIDDGIFLSSNSESIN